METRITPINIVSCHFVRGEIRDEFDSRGVRRFTETRAYLHPSYKHLYLSTRVDSNDGSFIRVGDNTKYRQNGSIEWRLVRDDGGHVIESKTIVQGNKSN